MPVQSEGDELIERDCIILVKINLSPGTLPLFLGLRHSLLFVEASELFKSNSELIETNLTIHVAVH